MHTELVPFALSNTAILTGIFMTSCRDLYSRGQAPLLLQLATYYKVACLNSLNEAIRASTGSFDTKVIVLAALLAGDEVLNHTTSRTLAQLTFPTLVHAW